MGIVLAKSLTFTRTVSIPRSSDALSSRKFPLHWPPYNSLAIAKAAVVFPQPAGTANRQWGREFFPIMYFRRSIMGGWLPISSSLWGLYFSTQIEDSIAIIQS